MADTGLPEHRDEQPDQFCDVCGKKIGMQIYKNTGVCCESCEDIRDGKKDHPVAQTDAGITNLINQPEGIDPGGIS